MDGLCFHAGGFRHALRCPSRWRGKHNFLLLLLQYPQYGIDGGGFACTRSACDNQHAAAHGLQHSKPLFLRQYHAGFFFYPFDCPRNGFRVRRLIFRRKLQQVLCDCHLRIKIIIQIHAVPAGFLQPFLPELAVYLQLPYGIFHRQRVQPQQLHGILDQFSLWQKTVPVCRRIVQHIFHSRFHAVRVILGNADVRRHFIRHFEANAQHIVRKTVRIVFHNVKRTVLKLFIYLHGIGWGNIKALQKHHCATQLMLFAKNL